MFNKCLLFAIIFLLTSVHIRVQGVNRTDVYIPCEKDWFHFGGKCYRISGIDDRKLNWQDASKTCNNNGGHLVTISSKEIQEFVFAFLLLAAGSRTWIGLNSLGNETQYGWDDGTELNYTNWNENEPSLWTHLKEDCVEMLMNVLRGKSGEWNNKVCTDELPYICQMDEVKKKSVDPTICSSEMGGGWKFGDSCYNIVKENKTWEDAEKYCQDHFKGHLVKVLRHHVDYFLQYIVSNFIADDIWIGIKIREQFQQHFSSGWYGAYTNWRKKPKKFVDGTCVIRRQQSFWEVVPCTENYPFICEVSSVSPPDLKKPPEGITCPDQPNDWRDLGGEYCYFIDTTKGFKWYRAHFECIRRGGSLASIHSKAEIDALAPFVKFDTSAHDYNARNVFIGLYRSLAHGNEYVWADGSQINYTRWSNNLASTGDNKCIGMISTSMEWIAIDCEITAGYICSVRKSFPKVINDTKAVGDFIDRQTFIISIGVTISVLLMVNLLSVVICYFRPWSKKRRVKRSVKGIPLQPSLPSTHQQTHWLDENTGQVIINDCDYGYEVMP